MNVGKEKLEEVAKQLEGLEMLCQWQLSLARDLRGKAQTLIAADSAKTSHEKTADGESR